MFRVSTTIHYFGIRNIDKYNSEHFRITLIERAIYMTSTTTIWTHMIIVIIIVTETETVMKIGTAMTSIIIRIIG